MYIIKAALVSPFLDFITTIGENEDGAIREIEGWINVIQEKVMSWEAEQSTIQDSRLDEAKCY